MTRSRVLPSLEQDLADDGLADLYKNERIKLIKPYINMMDRGINFDRKVHRTWVKEKTDQLNKIESISYYHYILLTMKVTHIIFRQTMVSGGIRAEAMEMGRTFL